MSSRRLGWIGTLTVLALLASLATTRAHDGVSPDMAVLTEANSGRPSFEPFPAEGVQLVAWLSLEVLGDDIGATLSSGNDCWGYVSPDGNEYAIIGHSHGTAFVDITIPYDPIIVASIDGPISLWRDIKTYDEYAYVVSEGGDGIQVIDLTDIDDGTVSLEATITTSGTTATHNVAIDEESGFLYRCGGGSSGLRIYDLADPADPDYVASWTERYVHDAVIVTYDGGDYDGQEIAFCCAGGFTDPGLTILDVTDKDDIIELVHLEYDDAEYCHQAWISDDRQYLFLNDELDEIGTRIIDISDLEDPFVADTFGTGLDSIDHNLYVAGDLLFEANYTSGLRVFDISETDDEGVPDPVEIGYFDTWPDDDLPKFNGLWSCYPYFPSGLVIGSDLEKGLFVWLVGDPPLTFEWEGGVDGAAPELVSSGGATLTVRIEGIDDYEVDADSVQIHYCLEGETETTEAAMEEVEDGLFEFTLDTLECTEKVAFFVSAMTTDDRIAWDPPNAPWWMHTALAAEGQEEIFSDDMEDDGDWEVEDDSARGEWERVDPIGTLAAPEDDHSEDGSMCWVTGQGTAGGTLFEADIDGGTTTLISPILDLEGLDTPVIDYWRWFSNTTGASPEADEFVVEITDNDGEDWIEVETVGPGGEQISGGWFHHEFAVLDFVEATDLVRVRFIAGDEGLASVVEAAVDDFRVRNLDCGPCPVEFVRGDFDGDESVELDDAISGLSYLFDDGEPPRVEDAFDVNDDGGRDISDVIYLLVFLFLDGRDPPAPYPDPGCP